MINVVVDELTPCLKDARSGELVQTEVIRIKRKSFLAKYNKRNGWYTNWSELLKSSEVYALVIQGTVDIQGLVAIAKDENSKAIYIVWMCASPENNVLISDSARYIGVGGHLFAIAMRKSVEYGFEGYVHGYAANKNLLEHCVKQFSAEHIGIMHPYQFAISDSAAKDIM